jgi:arginine decarboxylase
MIGEENMMNRRAEDPSKAPLFEALLAHHSQKTASFHVPGHKSGIGIEPEAVPFFHNVMSIDLTEITGLDDLHQAEGVISEAQRLAAECFGAEDTYFLVGGSTVGNLAIITALCQRGDLLLVQRNVHKSVINGLMLAGVKAVFLPPMCDPVTGIATGVRIEDVEKAMHVYPEAKGLFVTNPNYYGMGIDLQPIVDFMHSSGKPILVDEAHGAHYGFHPLLPSSALSCGADAVVQSTHKMLTAMTMGAMLHVQGERMDRDLLRERLSMLQSSSPSYPIMASLDLARRQLHTKGASFIEQGLTVIRHFNELLDQLDDFGYIFGRTDFSNKVLKDPFKFTIYDRTGTMSGPDLKEALEAKGCFVEMADIKHVLLLFTPVSTSKDVNRVFQALRDISIQFELQKKVRSVLTSQINNIPPYKEISAPISFDLRGSRHLGQQAKEIPIQEAVGRRSAVMVIPYPPGIPLLYPGELITSETAEYLLKLIALGIKFHGGTWGQGPLEKETIISFQDWKVQH